MAFVSDGDGSSRARGILGVFNDVDLVNILILALGVDFLDVDIVRAEVDKTAAIDRQKLRVGASLLLQGVTGIGGAIGQLETDHAHQERGTAT